MINCKRGDVVLVPFPFSSQGSLKKRPAVIISSNKYNNSCLDVIVNAVTSKFEQPINQYECYIDDWQIAGLLKESVLKPAITTIEKTLIIKCLGVLSEKDIKSMNKYIIKLCELNEK